MIGITAVILTVGLGEGAQQQVGLGDLGAGLQPADGDPGQHHVELGHPRRLRLGLDPDRRATPPPSTPRSWRPTSTPWPRPPRRRRAWSRARTNWTTSVVGTDPSWLTVRGRSMTEGRFIVAHDLATRAEVVVLGATTAQELFGFRDPVGPDRRHRRPADDGDRRPQHRRLVVELVDGGQPRRPGDRAADHGVDAPVRGLQPELGQPDPDPGRRRPRPCRPPTRRPTPSCSSLHGITTPTGADFTITSEQQVLSTATSVDRTLTVLLGGIAGISLLVGGIGVMNIMLVSVTERIREIGLRKALGATPRVIRRQFLVEASVLGTVGGSARRRARCRRRRGAARTSSPTRSPCRRWPPSGPSPSPSSSASSSASTRPAVPPSSRRSTHSAASDVPTDAGHRHVPEPQQVRPTQRKEATMHDTTKTSPSPAHRPRSRPADAADRPGRGPRVRGRGRHSPSPPAAARPGASSTTSTTAPAASLARPSTLPGAIGHDRRGQRDLARGPEPDNRPDDGDLHARPTAIRQITTTSAVRGDGRLVHLGLRQADHDLVDGVAVR